MQLFYSLLTPARREYGCLWNSLSRNRWGRSREMQFKLALRLILTWQSHSEKYILEHELLLRDGEERWWVTLPVFLSMSSFLQLSYHQTTRQQREPPRIPGIKSRTRYWCLTNWSCMPATTQLIYVPKLAVVTRQAVSADGSSGVPRPFLKRKNSFVQIHFLGGAR